ncbi:hypothetical protein [Paraburkholderia nodosa]|uniref:hypothetical protein n=1 Tax=Paraburkholderia nodosa TaxID=392320 RepID=UPI00048305A6|nr:hypothetical protein [Paraburkholderia nodosa]
MTPTPLYEIEPRVLVSGSPGEADRFLVAVLFGTRENLIPVEYVLNWMKLFHERGDDFASRAATCQYWLYEHHRGYIPDPPSAN